MEKGADKNFPARKGNSKPLRRLREITLSPLN